MHDVMRRSDSPPRRAKSLDTLHLSSVCRSCCRSEGFRYPPAPTGNSESSSRTYPRLFIGRQCYSLTPQSARDFRLRQHQLTRQPVSGCSWSRTTVTRRPAAPPARFIVQHRRQASRDGSSNQLSFPAEDHPLLLRCGRSHRRLRPAVTRQRHPTDISLLAPHT